MAQQRAQERPSDKLSAALESLDTGLESLDQPEEPPYKPLNMGLMPGEVAQPSAAETMANNPATAMPGEPGKMPGER